MANEKTTLFPNFRDLGGLPCEDGRVIRSGKIYRTSKLNLSGNRKEQQETKAFVDGLCLDIILDFRSEREVKEKPDYVPEGTRYYHVPFFAKGEVELILVTRRSIAHMLSLRGKHISKLKAAKDESYAIMPFSNGGVALRALFEAMDRGDTLAFHCTEGKDRTGFAGYVLEWCLGRPEAGAREEYLKSNESMEEKMAKQARLMRLLLMPEELIDALDYAEHCQNHLLDLSLSAVLARYDSLNDWLEQEYGVTETRKQAWRDTYLQSE